MIILWNSLILCYVFVLLVWVKASQFSPWATPEQEAQDEKNDVAILKAVFTSMEEYWRQRLIGGHRKKRADSVVCYDDLGCFEDTGPFGYIGMLPSSPEEISTKFELYSQNGRIDEPVMGVPYSNMTRLWSWASKGFNATIPTKIIVHGFGSSCSHVWVYEMRSALMSVEECNVICVDWEAGAVMPNYVRAAANTRLVGKQLAMLIRGLSDWGLTLDKIHLIGFSLGAHVAGFAGAELKNVSRITGLDPAGPLFESQDPKVRLDETDALFVDVIHSNGENLILGGLGSWQAMGHVDFYPNGGRMQKGCTNLFVGAVSDIIWSASDIEGRSLCNHRRAYKFFTDSVSPRCQFPAFPCETYEKFVNGKCFPCTAKQECGNMGYYADKSSARGSLYLITREEEPFCAHQYHVKVESSPSRVPVFSYGKIQITLIGKNLINETFTLTKKDDDELGVGTTLTKIVVPHPALEPLAVEIVYIAYSGWISSGLRKWSIDKVKLSDSYGKSMSHCKKDLVLESKIPVAMKLFPGDCNLPKEAETAATEDVDPFFVTESSNRKTENGTVASASLQPTTTAPAAAGATPAPTSKPAEMIEFVVDGFPAYVGRREYYEIHQKNETKGVATDGPMPKTEKNNTAKVIFRRQEIAEPVLQPKSAGRNMKEEIREPVLRVTERVEIVEETTAAVENPSKKSQLKPRGMDLDAYAGRDTRNRFGPGNSTKPWSLSQEMHPPPLGSAESWDRVAATSDPKASTGLAKVMHPPGVKHQKTDSVSPVTLQSKMSMQKEKANKKYESSEGIYNSDGNSFIEQSKNEDGSVTVQLVPRYLAAILKQAEQFAKANFFGSLELFDKSNGGDGDKSSKSSQVAFDRNRTKPETETGKKRRHLEDLAVPREIEGGGPKNFLPTIYEYVEKGLEGMKYFFNVLQSRGESQEIGEVATGNEAGKTGNESADGFQIENADGLSKMAES